MITSTYVCVLSSSGLTEHHGVEGAWLKNNKRKRQILQLTTAHYLKYIIHEYTSIWHTYVVVYTNRHSMDSIVYDMPWSTWQCQWAVACGQGVGVATTQRSAN